MDKLKKRTAEIILVLMIFMVAYASSIFGNFINEKVEYKSIYYLYGLVFSSLPGLLLIFTTLSESIASSNEFLIKRNQDRREIGLGTIFFNIILFVILVIIFSISIKSYFFYTILLQLIFILIFMKNEYIQIGEEMKQKNDDLEESYKYNEKLFQDNRKLEKKISKYEK